MVEVVMYSSSWCGFCVRAQRLLKAKHVDFVNIDVTAEPDRRVEMMQRSGRRTVPQIWIDEEHIGGCDELYALERSGQLDKKLHSESE